LTPLSEEIGCHHICLTDDLEKNSKIENVTKRENEILYGEDYNEQANQYAYDDLKVKEKLSSILNLFR